MLLSEGNIELSPSTLITSVSLLASTTARFFLFLFDLLIFPLLSAIFYLLPKSREASAFSGEAGLAAEERLILDLSIFETVLA